MTTYPERTTRKEHSLVLSILGITEAGFDFKLFLQNTFYLAAFLCMLVAAGIIGKGIGEHTLFVNYDIGIYYIYTSIMLFCSGAIARSNFKS